MSGIHLIYRIGHWGLTVWCTWRAMHWGERTGLKLWVAFKKALAKYE